MRAIVRRVYQRDYIARPDPPEINRVPHRAYEPEPVAEEPPACLPSVAPSHAEADDRADTVPPQFAEPSDPPSAPGLTTFEEAVTSARAVRVRQYHGVSHRRLKRRQKGRRACADR